MVLFVLIVWINHCVIGVKELGLYLKHFVRAGFDSRNHVSRAISALLDLGEVIFRVSVQHHFSDRPKMTIYCFNSRINTISYNKNKQL